MKIDNLGLFGRKRRRRRNENACEDFFDIASIPGFKKIYLVPACQSFAEFILLTILKLFCQRVIKAFYSAKQQKLHLVIIFAQSKRFKFMEKK
jgi:hypothetical protein